LSPSPAVHLTAMTLWLVALLGMIHMWMHRSWWIVWLAAVAWPIAVIYIGTVFASRLGDAF
jgi:1,4-dihydroxy-2-naphthoate octaprenyltransferase